MADLPVRLGAMETIPPGIRYRVSDVMAMLSSGAFEGVAAERLARLLEDGEPYLGADPSLAQLGYWMIGPERPVELRRRGCAWLTMFPSVETAT
ncbi:MAG TPA: hypothetical protein VGC41_01055, partial [Kofleriaceae bacterium]